MKRLLLAFLLLPALVRAEDEIRVGWIGPLAGPATKYGAWECAQVAFDEIRQQGGIAGKKVTVIAEDGQCNPKWAVKAVQKLIAVDRVKYIIGGHCSPESVPIVDFTKKAGVIQISSISSSPALSGAGEFVFRLTGDIRDNITHLGRYVGRLQGKKRVALLHEETDYNVPEAKALLDEFKRHPTTEIVFTESYLPGTTDFRAVLLKVKSKNPDYLFTGVQTPDTAELIAIQAKEIGLNAGFLGNTITVSAAKKRGDKLFNGLLGVDASLDPQNRKANHLTRELQRRFQMEGPPLGMLSAEAYDAPHLLKWAIETCGEAIQDVARCLEEVQDFPGAAGTISFDEQHNALQQYGVGRYQDGVWGRIKEYRP